MIEMILYSFTIMYTPGPVTMTAINIGLNRRLKEGIPFYLGIGFAIFALYILFGYLGSWFIREEYLIGISFIGSLYMFYMGVKIFKSDVNIAIESNKDGMEEKKEEVMIGLRGGFLMQFFNPKAAIAVIPVVTIYFPMYNITGIRILLMALFFMVLVIGSPALYAFVGQSFSTFIHNERILRWTNKVMALILLYISWITFYQHFILKVI